MQNSAKRLMHDAVKCGYKLRVYYTEGNDMAYATGVDVEKAYEATQDCDIGILYLIPHKKIDTKDWALIIHGNNDDELISDHVVGGFIDRWSSDTDYGQESMSREFKQRESI
tara:strand:+ start:412 stop:747 length:336 start_codon:yes stop_codon:yes gene_type:complete